MYVRRQGAFNHSAIRTDHVRSRERHPHVAAADCVEVAEREEDQQLLHALKSRDRLEWYSAVELTVAYDLPLLQLNRADWFQDKAHRRSRPSVERKEVKD